MIKRN